MVGLWLFVCMGEDYMIYLISAKGRRIQAFLSAYPDVGRGKGELWSLKAANSQIQWLVLYMS